MKFFVIKKNNKYFYYFNNDKEVLTSDIDEARKTDKARAKRIADAIYGQIEEIDYDIKRSN